MLDEPTNDLDTDMLAAMKDLLDSWPGTLIVVSHDRYFLERVTDQQYALLDGRLRHLPGGVDEYLRLGAAATRSLSEPQARRSDAAADTTAGGMRDSRTDPAHSSSSGAVVLLSGAERRAAEKELASLERRVERLQQQAAEGREALAARDQSDYEGLAAAMSRITALEDEAAELETRWLELSERLG